MSDSPNPGLPVRATRTRPPTPRRPLRPSGPGALWTLSPTLKVRFNRDMKRLYREQPGHKNLVQFRYRTGGSANDRPTDAVLGLLCAMFTQPAVDGDGSRCWILRQTSEGWALALEVHNGDRSFELPTDLAGRGTPPGLSITRDDVRTMARTARTLWQLADQRIIDPARYTEEMMNLLKG